MSSAEETNALTRFFFLQEQLVVCYLLCPQFGGSLPLRERERSSVYRKEFTEEEGAWQQELVQKSITIDRRRRSMATRTNAKIHHN
jgi:hypothetical protein